MKQQFPTKQWPLLAFTAAIVIAALPMAKAADLPVDQNLSSLRLTADALFANRDPAGALAYYTEILNARQTDIAAYNARARIYFDLNLLPQTSTAPSTSTSMGYRLEK